MCRLLLFCFNLNNLYLNLIAELQRILGRLWPMTTGVIDFSPKFCLVEEKHRTLEDHHLQVQLDVWTIPIEINACRVIGSVTQPVISKSLCHILCPKEWVGRWSDVKAHARYFARQNKFWKYKLQAIVVWSRPPFNAYRSLGTSRKSSYVTYTRVSTRKWTILFEISEGAIINSLSVVRRDKKN